MTNKKGFTLVEMLMVIAVVGTLSVLVSVQFVGTRERLALDQAEQLVSSDVRQVIGWATLGRRDQGVAPEGYGVRFMPQTSAYELYASSNGDLGWSAGDTLIDEVDLVDEELIQYLEFSACLPLHPTLGGCDLFVQSPSGVLYINGAQQDDLTLTLLHTRSTQERVLTVHRTTGRIDAQ